MREKVSVAMATYNGEKFIEEQIRSILVNLNEEDELIISDDGSKDGTLSIINAINDDRIKYHIGPREGVKKNFENAIRHCRGKYIFLCDQDDVWVPNKVEKVLDAFAKNNCKVVIHDCQVVSEDGSTLINSFFEYKKSGPGAVKNFITNTYVGCCMAFDASMKDIVVPIPNDIEMHDQWIGILGDLLGKNVFLSDKLIYYRRHESNSSDMFHHYGFMKMLTNRIHLFMRLTSRLNNRHERIKGEIK